MAKLSFTEKLLLVKDLTRQIISYPAFSYNKLKELLTLCSDTSIDVVLKAVQSLCEVYCDILPDYRIRTHNQDEEPSNVKLSKDVVKMRSHE